MTILTVNPAPLKAIKAVLEALEIPFSLEKQEKRCDSAFVAKIEQGRAEAREGKGVKMK